MATTLKTASVLAFERKLDPSDALLYAGRWDDTDKGTTWPGLEIREKSVRGTISNRLKTKDQDPAKVDASIQSPNLQTVDVAALPPGADTLRLRFTLRVLSGAGTPSACNNVDYQEKLQQVVDQYVGGHGFKELAQRYACNIANARFLWRNRLGAETVRVLVRHLKDGEEAQSWEFDALNMPYREFSGVNAKVEELAHVIEQGLSGKDAYALLEVVAYVRVGDGQEVYPSQELIMGQGGSRGQKSKTLYHVGGVAAMHSQKIGNALRTIDTWYPKAEGQETMGPIAVEPYGSVTSQGKAYRQPKSKQDFYNLLDNWVLKDKAPESEQQHFVMANLIRGGVFGDSGKE